MSGDSLSKTPLLEAATRNKTVKLALCFIIFYQTRTKAIEYDTEYCPSQ